MTFLAHIYDCLVVYTTYNAIRACLIQLNLLAVPSLVNYMYMKRQRAELSALLAPLVSGFNRNINTSSHSNSGLRQRELSLAMRQKQFQLYQFLKRFLGEHHRILHNNQYVGRRMIGPLMSVTFITNVLVSACMLAIFPQLTNFVEQLLLLAILVAETALTVISCFMFVSVSDYLHAPHPLIYRAQLVLDDGGSGGVSRNSRITLLQLKLMTAYELIHARNRFLFEVNGTGHISKRSLAEGFRGYSALLMFILNLTQSV